jgi:diguanylate cyclase (GGDEF)-like protein
MSKEHRLLIVEDDESTRELLKEALKDQGYDIKEADSGLSGFKIAETWGPDLVITDHDMPDATGLEMLKMLRERDNYVSVIFVSAHTDAQLVATVLKSGADDFLRKPFQIVELRARVEATLRQNIIHRKLFEANKKLQQLVDQDYLTGLYNMRSIYEKIGFELKRAKRFKRKVGCIMFDMDHFKRVNDNNDHLFGSFVLKEVGKLVKDIIREIDFAARYGGDEFLVVLTETSSEGVRVVAERIRERIEGYLFQKGENSMRLTASMGFAVHSPVTVEDMNPKKLVREADHALYRAKENGRNRVEEAKVG